MRFCNAVLLVLMLLFGYAMPAAADFADQFRTFILGAETPAPRNQPIDTLAQGCMQCHDGSRASHITLRRSGSPMQIRGSQTLNHPVGMVYDDAVRKDPQGYRARAALQPKIQLVNGQVTCVSCHQLRMGLVTATNTQAIPAAVPTNSCTATKELTTGHGDRALCLACHIK
jgi:hypothetical protein